MTVETGPGKVLPNRVPRPLSSAAGASAAMGDRFTCGALYVTFRGAGLLLSKGLPRSSPCCIRSSTPIWIRAPDQFAAPSRSIKAGRAAAALKSLRFEELMEILDV